MAKINDFCAFQNQQILDSDKRNQMSLREAIRSKNIDLVRHLLRSGTEANGFCMNILYHRPLHLAVISRSLEVVDLLLKAGANINVKSYNGETPLTLAAKLENTLIVDLLLSYDIENEKDEFNLGHLHIACMRNKIDVVKKLLLINKIENVDNINRAVGQNSMCWAGYTPLHFAVHYGCIETVKFLLKCKADFTAKDAKQMTPLHLADFFRNEEIIDLILTEHKHDLRNPVNAQGLSHFHIASTRDDASVIEHFIKSGVNVNLKVNVISSPWKWWTPIDFATYYECPNVIKLLMSTEIDRCNFTYSHLLKLSFRMGNETIYKLVSRRRDKFMKSNRCEGLTDLHQACIKNDTAKLEMLLFCNKISTPSDFDTPIWTGCTPVHLAIQYKSTEVVKFLLNHGANPMMQNSEGKTLLHIAFDLNQSEIVDGIVKTLETIQIQNLTDHAGLSFFHIVCSTDALATIENFISQGVDINTQVGSESAYWAGFTPIHFAILFRKSDVVSLLIKHDADILIKNGSGCTPFDLLVDRISQQIFDRYDQQVISEMFMAIFSSLRKHGKESSYKAITPLHALCININSDLTELHQYLILHPDEINKTTNISKSPRSDRCTALHLAFQRHHFNQAKLLIEKGADLLMVNAYGETPLECITLLGSEYPRPDADLLPLSLPIKSIKPIHFHLACALGLTSTVRHLLENADEELKSEFINSRNDDRQTPLHSALTSGLSETSVKQITHLLLEHGSDVNVRDMHFSTPLQDAFSDLKSLDVPCTLLSYGADVNHQDLYGQTSLYQVTRSCLKSTKKKLVLLLENGADVNIMDETGHTCLMGAFRRAEIGCNITDCYVTLLKHICKLRVIGWRINNENQKAYRTLLLRSNGSFNETDFIGKCNKELESMINVSIGSFSTLHDILSKSLNQMAFHSNNVVLQTVVDTSEFFKKFPIYGFLIRLQLKRGRVRGPLLVEFEKSLIFLSKKSLTSSCLGTISQYLSNADLKNIILSAKNRNANEILSS